jgi:multidrug efflux pump subunit AcrB
LVARIAGETEDEERTLEGLGRGLLIALVAIYLLLAIPLKSYVQAFILLLTLPIGVGGAVLAHAVVGVEVSVISLFGAVALLGVLVNNGLILLHTANALRSSGMDAATIATTAAVRRLRPVALTTITTAVGLAPMIFEGSPQAQFMAPMALSLAGGLLLATPWILILIPMAFVMLEKLRNSSARA